MTDGTSLAPVANGPQLPDAVSRRGITDAQWRTLTQSLYPGARAESVLMVLDYCKARQLDPLKKPCHIVPMQVKVGDRYEWRDVILPGIYEHRTTAHRTGHYLGHTKPDYGPLEVIAGVTAPTWCDITVYRWNPTVNQRAEFPVRVWFAEAVATKADGKANQRWSKAPTQMLTKVAEAAALREAFPDELGGLHVEEEMDGQRAIGAVEVTPAAPVVESPAPVKPEGYDEWLKDLVVAAESGETVLRTAWKESAAAPRQYLLATEPESWASLKARAAAVDAAAPTEAEGFPQEIVG